jgi:peptidyl-prolyl cis-trans isomerase A (cyclophilin A)
MTNIDSSPFAQRRRSSHHKGHSKYSLAQQRLLRLLPLLSLAVFLALMFLHDADEHDASSSSSSLLDYPDTHNSSSASVPMSHHLSTVFLDDTLRNDIPIQHCPYMSLEDLTSADRPQGLLLAKDSTTDTAASHYTLVCCITTAGPWNILVHHAWAPHGAQRFLDMVRAGYFSRKVPLMRCVDDWLCQFGLAGLASEDWTLKIPDDPQWMTAAATADGVRNSNQTSRLHFPRGYFGYTGYGPRTRGRQFFVALSDHNEFGKELWEVPWGELVGAHSFETLRHLYTGYGEDGPDQNRMIQAGAHEYLLQDFPDLDYITSCHVVGVE